MLRIIEGGFSSGAEEMILREIEKNVTLGKRTFLIVPEQQTVGAEAEASIVLPKNAPLYFEVTNFTRLANTVFRSLGGVAVNYCNKAQRALIMWRALTELSPMLNMTAGKREVSSGAVERALSAISEMQSRAIDADALREIEGEAEKRDRRLSQKISDLSKIMALYKKLLSEKYADAADDLEAVIKKMKANPDFFCDTAFYIEGFASFTEPQHHLICEISARAEVTVHLTIPKAMPDAFEYTEISNTKKRLIKYADRRGVEKKLTKLDGRRGTNEFLSECSDLLWRTGGGLSHYAEEYGDALRIFEAKTPYEECDFIAADIRRRVAEGARYRDFAIIARRAEDYLDVIDSALSDASIPTFLSKRRDVSSFEATKLIYTAFSAVTGGMKREDVISYAKCSPAGISRDACDEFELYTDMWQITGRRFTDGDVWSMNPDGYTTRRTERANERLLSINETRRALIEPLMHLDAELSHCNTVLEHARALVNFLTEIGLEESIAERTKTLASLGEDTAAEENAALWKVICASLDTLVDALGDTPCDRDGFLSELKVVFSFADIGRIPSYYDAVTVGGADMLRLSDKKHVYLIGVNRGEFPMTVQPTSYFTDRDKETLSSLGLSIEPDTEARGAQELYFFTRAFTYAKESVTILYTTLSSQLSPTLPAEVIARIEELTEKKIIPKRICDIEPWELIYSPTTALEALGNFDTDSYIGAKRALFECGFENSLRIAEGRIENDSHTLTPDARALIYKKDMALTQSRIDSYNSCPLSYFCRYNLSLLEEERAEFDARNIGSFIHAILESFFDRLRREGIKIADLTPEMKEDAVRRGAKEYLDLIDAGAREHTRREEILLDRLCRAAMPVVDGICEEFRECDFTPRFFELNITKDKPDLPEPCEFKSADGATVYVYGSIDRVDTYTSKEGEVFVRVVDYKTGKKVFSPDDIDEGVNLQMFLYLKSVVDTKNREFLARLGVKEGDSPVPAGVIYLKTEIGDVRIDTPSESDARAEIMKAQSRQGMVLSEPEVIRAMNVKYLPIKFTKSGAIDSRTAKKAYTREGWNSLSEKLGEVVGGIAGRMRSGEIYAKSIIDTKKNTPCEYCKFKAFCRKVKI